ncbi:carboxymuconolactone decarboxylase family protein [Halanaerobaculum tunisiense]
MVESSANRVSTIKPEEAKNITKDIFIKIEDKLGSVPNLYRTLGHKPDTLRATWELMELVMEDDLLPRKLKKLVALRVSTLNQADYCIDKHYQSLQQIGYPDEVLAKVKKGEYEKLTEIEAKVLKFIDKALAEEYKLQEADFTELQFKEEEILELVTVVQLFSGLNSFTKILDIKLD